MLFLWRLLVTKNLSIFRWFYRICRHMPILDTPSTGTCTCIIHVPASSHAYFWHSVNRPKSVSLPRIPTAILTQQHNSHPSPPEFRAGFRPGFRPRAPVTPWVSRSCTTHIPIITHNLESWILNLDVEAFHSPHRHRVTSEVESINLTL